MIKESYQNHKLRQEAIYYSMDSGLQIILIPKKGYNKKYAIFATNYGSNDNEFVPTNESVPIKVPEGIAHFLEHKLFEEPEGNIFEKFSALGTDVNAFTNFNQTAYLFSCTDNFYESLDLLIKFVQNPYFTDENIEKEKGIIGQEIKMYEDNPEWKVFFNTLKNMYFTHPVKIDIAGTLDSIEGINKETLYKCYNTFYNPKNMILVMVGDISTEKAIEVVKGAERTNLKGDESILRIYPEERKGIVKKHIEENLVTSMPLFAIGFKDEDIGYDGIELVKKELSINILLDMLIGASSNFYNELYEEGLIDGSFGGQYTGYRDYGHSIISGQSNRPEVVAEKIVNLFKQIKIKGLSNEDFIRIKNKNLGFYLMGFDSLEYIGNNYVNYYFLNFNFTDYLDILEKITYEDVIDRFNMHFNGDNCVLSVIKPV